MGWSFLAERVLVPPESLYVATSLSISRHPKSPIVHLARLRPNLVVEADTARGRNPRTLRCCAGTSGSQVVDLKRPCWTSTAGQVSV
jgi:hypothetical protein